MTSLHRESTDSLITNSHSPIVFGQSPTELKQKQILVLQTMVPSRCASLKLVGPLMWLPWQILALSLHYTIMYYKLAQPYLVRAKSDGVETKTDFSVVDHGPITLCKFEARRTVNVVTMANFGFECPLYYNVQVRKNIFKKCKNMQG